MLLNYKPPKTDDSLVQIRVGEILVKQEKSTKLLGVVIQDNQEWKQHFYGKNGLINSLNKRLFAIGRVAHQIPRDKLAQLAHALWMSKLRYGLQLCTNVRTTDSESKNCNMKAVQVAQNKLLRLLLDIPSNDRTSTSELLAKTGLLSVNQLAVSIKMLEAWKSENLNNYPVQLEPNSTGQSVSDRAVRPSTSRKWNQDTKFFAAKECFSRNTAKIWNSAPSNIRTSKNINSAKNEIKKYCKTLPI